MTVAAKIFPDLGAIPEDTDAFSSQEFAPSTSGSTLFSVQVDTSDMDNPATGQYTVLGSNISDAEADMVPVTNEQGNSGAMPLGTPFVAKDFAFKFIGIKYDAMGNTGTGDLTIYYNQAVQRVNIS